MTHPIQRPGQSLCAHKREVADWMGYGSVEAMDRDHDATHASLCRWLGIPSYALKQARGEPLNPVEQRLADIEEDAALAVQRLAQSTGAVLP